MPAPVTVPITAAATQVYTPAAVGKPHAVLFNAGPGVVYIGGAGVTPANGLPLYPRNELDFATAPLGIYAVAGGATLSGTVTTTASAAITHGASTQISVAASASFAAGMIVQVGAGTAAETLVVASRASSTITFTGKPQYDHATGVAVTQVTGATTGTLRVSVGSA